MTQSTQLSFDDITPRLPTRYEDLDQSFRGSLRPNQALLDVTKAAFQSIRITGGLRLGNFVLSYIILFGSCCPSQKNQKESNEHGQAIETADRRGDRHSARSGEPILVVAREGA